MTLALNLDRKAEAAAVVHSHGVPHRRIEEWKYTDLRALMREVLPLAAAPDAAALERAAIALSALSADDGARRLVLVDGMFTPSLSNLSGLEPGVEVRPLREMLELGRQGSASLLDNGTVDGAMISLNAAMATDGVLIGVAQATALAKPIHIVHVATRSSAASYTRSFLEVGNAARVTLLESFVAADGANAYQTNDALTVRLGENVELHQVMAATEEASISLQMLVEIRNKFTEAYKTVIQMQG